MNGVISSTWITITLIIGYLTVQTGTIAFNMCISINQLTPIGLHCTPEHQTDDHQIQIHTAYIGRSRQTFECNTPGETIPGDSCKLPAAEQTDEFRAACNTKKRTCSHQVYYKQGSCHSEYDLGVSFLFVQYECRRVLDPENVPITIINPMQDINQTHNSRIQMALQSPGYPSNDANFHTASCRIDIPQESKVRVDIYDLSYHENSTDSPYCFITDKELKCAEKGSIYTPFDLPVSTNVRFEMNQAVTQQFYGRFWILLTALTTDDKFSRMNVSCHREGVSSSGNSGGTDQGNNGITEPDNDPQTPTTVPATAGAVNNGIIIGSTVAGITVISVITIILVFLFLKRDRSSAKSLTYNHHKNPNVARIGDHSPPSPLGPGNDYANLDGDELSQTEYAEIEEFERNRQMSMLNGQVGGKNRIYQNQQVINDHNRSKLYSKPLRPIVSNGSGMEVVENEFYAQSIATPVTDVRNAGRPINNDRNLYTQRIGRESGADVRENDLYGV